MIRVYLEGISVIGPGMPYWATARQVLRQEAPLEIAPVTLTAPDILPATERRRSGTATRLSMSVGLAAARDAGQDPATLANVFSSTGGDCDNCHALLETLASDDRMVSPTRFHNSVHNAPAGYWGIATQCMAPSTSLCAYDATLGAGLLEAATMATDNGQPCLLIAFDTAYPEPLFQLRPIPYPFGVGMVLGATATASSRAQLTLSLVQAPADVMQDAALETLRQQIPSARALPLLQLLANETAGRVVLDYLDGCQLAVEVAF